jgi:uncharacterized repeat protein (TIGR01451 family)
LPRWGNRRAVNRRGFGGDMESGTLARITGISYTVFNRRRWRIVAAGLLVICGGPVFAVGTPVGTLIENTATVNFDLAGTPITVTTNTTTVTVVERIDVLTTLQSGQIQVTANDTNQALLFTVTNIGNGTESFLLDIDSVIAGSDFDPIPSAPDSIYLDSDGDGIFNPANDTPYVQGNNDPDLAADESIGVFLLNDIPGTVVNGDIGRSQLTATSTTGTGAPGTVYPGQGDGNVDAVIGTTEGDSSSIGEYLVSVVMLDVIKSQLVTDQFGGAAPIPGATITYTITVQVMSTGTATGSVLGDPIPTNSTYVASSITLNGVGLTDAVDGDAGEIIIAGTPSVVVRLGDLTLVSGLQTVTFQVTID